MTNVEFLGLEQSVAYEHEQTVKKAFDHIRVKRSRFANEIEKAKREQRDEKEIIKLIWEHKRISTKCELLRIEYTKAKNEFDYISMAYRRELI